MNIFKNTYVFLSTDKNTNKFKVQSADQNMDSNKPSFCLEFNTEKQRKSFIKKYGCIPVISDDEFSDIFVPINNHIDENAGFDGRMFETFGEELEFVKKQDQKNIWTYIEGDNGSLWITAGFHLVNRIGYFITGKQWETGTEEYFVGI